MARRRNCRRAVATAELIASASRLTLVVIADRLMFMFTGLSRSVIVRLLLKVAPDLLFLWIRRFIFTREVQQLNTSLNILNGTILKSYEINKIKL